MNNNEYIPPRPAERLLLWFLRDDLAEEVLGDLEEKFHQTAESRSLLKAKLNYWYQVLHYLRPFAIRNYRSNNSNFLIMYKTHFKIGWRNLRKNRGYSLINIGGLSLAMTIVIIIGLWVWDEVSYNKYHDNYKSIARVVRHETQQGTRYTNDVQPTGLGTLLKSDYSNLFKHVVMVRSRTEERTIGYGDKLFLQPGYFMQPGGAELFSLKMKYGNRKALQDKNTIFISEKLADKLFKQEDPIGKAVSMDSRWDLTVTGVYEDLPANSEFHEATYFAPLDLYLDGWSSLDVWDNYNMNIYVQVNEGVGIGQASAAIDKTMQPHVDRSAADIEVFLHPMSQWHLHAEFENGAYVTSKALLLVWFIGIFGVFILLLACINFMNLSTARSNTRIKEMGIRKVTGSTRGQLISQFLSEAFLVSLAAFIASLALAWLTLPWFNQLTEKQIVIPWANPWLWISGLSFVCFTALLAGSYPAFYLSSARPVKALKGTLTTARHAIWLRKVMVVMQFSISVTLIIGTIIVYQQIQFGENRSMGYSSKGLVALPIRSAEINNKYDLLRSELKKTGFVMEIAESNYPITSSKGWNPHFHWPGREPDNNPAFNTMYVTHEYDETVGLEFTMGRGFSNDFASDQSSIVINESALELMGLEEPIGETVTWHPPFFDKPQNFTIIGVTKDIIKNSPYESTFPSIIFLSENNLNELLIKLDPEAKVAEALPEIERVFKTITPSMPFDYKFVDQEYAKTYANETRIGKFTSVLAFLAIVISCLGLFGMSSFVAEQRLKELGIRKVLGASITSLWHLLSKDFVILIAIACLIAVPVSYYLANQWLNNYEYHIEIAAWPFLAAGAGAIIIALITMSFNIFKAALNNPVNTLKAE